MVTKTKSLSGGDIVTAYASEIVNDLGALSGQMKLNPSGDQLPFIHPDSKVVLTRAKSSECEGASYRLGVTGADTEAVYVNITTMATKENGGQFLSDNAPRLGSACLTNANAVNVLKKRLGIVEFSSDEDKKREVFAFFRSMASGRETMSYLLFSVGWDLREGNLKEELLALPATFSTTVNDRELSRMLLGDYINYKLAHIDMIEVTPLIMDIAGEWESRLTVQPKLQKMEDDDRVKYGLEMKAIISTVSDAYPDLPPFGKLLTSYKLLAKSIERNEIKKR